jgi:hypothetical protein
MSPLPPKGDFSRRSLSLDNVQARRVTTHDAPCTKRRRLKEFVGPLPDATFRRLVVLPGKALAVYLILLQRWRIYSRKHPKATGFSLSSLHLRGYGIGRAVKSRALLALKSAGLIAVEARKNKNPIVTVLEEKPCP